MPEPFISRAAIADRVHAIAAALRHDVDGPVHCVGVLTGAFMFLADLMRAYDGVVTCDFLAVSSYGRGQRSSGEVRVSKDLDQSIEGRDVLIVEDIVDTGRTLSFLLQTLRARRPRSIRAACLLDKRSRREVDVPVDYVGFVIPDRFVVGYGMDFDGRYRNLPDIAVLDG